MGIFFFDASKYYLNPFFSQKTASKLNVEAFLPTVPKDDDIHTLTHTNKNTYNFKTNILFIAQALISAIIFLVHYNSQTRHIIMNYVIYNSL